MWFVSLLFSVMFWRSFLSPHRFVWRWDKTERKTHRIIKTSTPQVRQANTHTHTHTHAHTTYRDTHTPHPCAHHIHTHTHHTHAHTTYTHIHTTHMHTKHMNTHHTPMHISHTNAHYTQAPTSLLRSGYIPAQIDAHMTHTCHTQSPPLMGRPTHTRTHWYTHAHTHMLRMKILPFLKFPSDILTHPTHSKFCSLSLSLHHPFWQILFPQKPHPTLPSHPHLSPCVRRARRGAGWVRRALTPGAPPPPSPCPIPLTIGALDTFDPVPPGCRAVGMIKKNLTSRDTQFTLVWSERTPCANCAQIVREMNHMCCNGSVHTGSVNLWRKQTKNKIKEPVCTWCSNDKCLVRTYRNLMPV